MPPNKGIIQASFQKAPAALSSLQRIQIPFREVLFHVFYTSSTIYVALWHLRRQPAPCPRSDLFRTRSKRACQARGYADLYQRGDAYRDLEQANANGVTFKSPVAGELTVKWDKIKELKSNKQFAVVSKNEKLKRNTAASMVPLGTISVADSNVEVVTSSGTKTVPIAQTDAVVDAAVFSKQLSGPSGFLNGWAGAATAGASLVRSTQNQTTFTGAINLVRAIPTVDWLAARNRTLFDYNQAYGSTTQPAIGVQPSLTVKTNIFHVDGERDEYISNRVYYFGGVSFDHNFSQGLFYSSSTAAASVGPRSRMQSRSWTSRPISTTRSSASPIPRRIQTEPDRIDFWGDVYPRSAKEDRIR